MPLLVSIVSILMLVERCSYFCCFEGGGLNVVNGLASLAELIPDVILGVFATSLLTSLLLL